jgi:hypothetical protein
LRRLLGRGASEHFVLRDFLTVEAGRIAVETVIANPPFVSYPRMNGAQRRTVGSWREKYAPSFAMTASLWAYFLVHSMSFLKANGRLAFVLPSAATSSDYAQPLMDVLEGHFTRLFVYRVTEPLFIQAGADERTVILLAEGYREYKQVGCERLEHSVSSLEELNRLLNSAHTSTVHSLNGEPDSAATILEGGVSRGTLCRLGDLATVTIGEVVGDTNYFVKSKDAWGSLRIPERHLRPIVTRVRQLAGLRITAKDVAALYGGIPWLLTPPVNRIPESIRRYLKQYPRDKRITNSTFSKREPWYAVTYDDGAGAFIGAMSHDWPKIILNAAGISCANGLYKLTQRPGGKGLSSVAAASLTSPFRLSAEIHARIRGSGALKLEPSDVADLVMPSPDQSMTAAALRPLTDRLDELVRRKELHTATREADRALLIKRGVMSVRDLNAIHDRLQDLRGRRLATTRAGDRNYSDSMP